jgi:hypothetical protein
VQLRAGYACTSFSAPQLEMPTFREDRLAPILGQDDHLIALLDAMHQSRQESHPAEGRGKMRAGGEKKALLKSVPEGAPRAGTGVNYLGMLEGDSSSEGTGPSEEPERSLAHPPQGAKSILLLPPAPATRARSGLPSFLCPLFSLLPSFRPPTPREHINLWQLSLRKPKPSLRVRTAKRRPKTKAMILQTSS